MKFIYYHEGLAQTPVIVVDGFADHGFHLSHWIGNKTPEGLKADTSTEIVFNFLASSSYKEITAAYPFITNTHYDTDGVIGLFCPSKPRFGP